MATAELEHTDVSKRDRILNALAVYPDDTQISNQAIAEMTGASASYVYQLRRDIDEGELTDDEVDAAHDDDLQARYRERLQEAIGGSNGQRTMAEGDADEESEDVTPDSQPKAQPNGTISVEEIRHVRDVMEQYREDAAFERERFEGAGKNVAEEKYFIANRAIELIDRAIDP